MGNAMKHFKMVMRHKHWVKHYCFMCHEYWRGMTHDMSKFSPIEFSEGIRYYNGYRSPIELAKKKNGYSEAWLHHKGKNDHHYQYWTDDFDHGGCPIRMPYSPTVEMLCDYIGAAKAYNEKGFTYQKELDWWENKIDPVNEILMHDDTIQFMTIVFTALAELEKKYQKYAGEKTALSDGWAKKSILNEKTLTQLYDAITTHNDSVIEFLKEQMSTI